MIRNLTRSLRRGNRNDRQSRQMDLNAVVGSGATAFGVRRQPEPLAPEPRERGQRERDSRRVRQDAIREAKLRRMRGRSGESSEQEDGAPSQREREYMRHRFDREGYDAIHPLSPLQHAVLGRPPNRIWQQGDVDFATWRGMTEQERDAYRDRISARRNAEARHRFWEHEESGDGVNRFHLREAFRNHFPDEGLQRGRGE